jgi:hypothetical protein
MMLLYLYIASPLGLNPCWFGPGIDEAYMLHGTRTHSPARLAHSPDGFDLDGNPDCFYARAIYFAQRSCYSHAYAHRTADAEGEHPDPSGPYHHLIVALVLRGAAKREPAAWPKKERGQAGAARRLLGDEYDSVEGGPHRPSKEGPGKDSSLICAVYKSSQAIAEYVVTYKVGVYLRAFARACAYAFCVYARTRVQHQRARCVRALARACERCMCVGG